MAAKYIFGSSQASGPVSKLSGTAGTYARSVLQDPGKMENIISMVRTFAPLTSRPTINKVNTYLPAVEKMSTLLGMYSFINRAQHFRPIQALDAKSPVDKVTALLKNGNIPVAKLMAQPLLANNMDKIMSALVMNMAKNGGLNEVLSSLAKGNKDGLSDILSSLADRSGDNEGNKEGNNDLGTLMETLMPVISNLMHADQEAKESNNHKEADKAKETSEPQKLIGPGEANNIPPSTEKNIKHERHVQKPIRIRQRRR